MKRAACRTSAFALAFLGCFSGAGSLAVDPAPSETQLKREAETYQKRVQKASRRKEMRELLRRGEFAELGKELEGIQRDFEAGKRGEAEVYEAFYLLMKPDAQGDLDRWTAAHPKDWTAIAARGLRLTDAGARARGGHSISRTHPMQLDQMRDYFARAVPDLEATIASHPRFMPAYSRLIDVARMVGDPEMARAVFDEAVRHEPTTFIVRETYLEAIQPRWGGSLAEMESVARKAQPHVAANPQLRMLLGYPVANLAYDRVLAKDWTAAAALYTQALAHGRGMGWLSTRAIAYKKLGRLEDAIRDFDEALLYDPESADWYARRAGCYWALGQRDAELRDYARAVELAPNESWIVKGYARSLDRARRPDEAAAVYERYIAAHPSDPDMIEEFGMLCRTTLRRPDRAREVFARLVEIDPQRASGWRSYGDALRDLGDPRAREVYGHYLEIVDLRVPFERVMAERVRSWLAANQPPAAAPH